MMNEALRSLRVMGSLLHYEWQSLAHVLHDTASQQKVNQPETAASLFWKPFLSAPGVVSSRQQKNLIRTALPVAASVTLCLVGLQSITWMTLSNAAEMGPEARRIPLQEINQPHQCMAFSMVSQEMVNICHPDLVTAELPEEGIPLREPAVKAPEALVYQALTSEAPASSQDELKQLIESLERDVAALNANPNDHPSTVQTDVTEGIGLRLPAAHSVPTASPDQKEAERTHETPSDIVFRANEFPEHAEHEIANYTGESIIMRTLPKTGRPNPFMPPRTSVGPVEVKPVVKQSPQEVSGLQETPASPKFEPRHTSGWSSNPVSFVFKQFARLFGRILH